MSSNGKILLSTSETLSALLIERGITTWDQAISYIQQLPYGRNANRKDFSLVISERKGTCSSKHAALKTIADENKIEGVKLMLGIYKMTQANTPGIGSHILKSGVPYIPEAHCYLLLNEERKEYTTPSSCISSIENVILSETEIAPRQVSEWKVDFHRQYIKTWRISEGIAIDFDTLWEVRENCISSLSDSK